MARFPVNPRTAQTNAIAEALLLNVRRVSQAVYLLPTDGVLLVDAGVTGQGIVIGLPRAHDVPGRAFIVKKIDASAHRVTLAAVANDTIDNAVQLVLDTAGRSVVVISDGTSHWWSVSEADSLTPTGVVPGTYGDATHVGRFTVDAFGDLTFAQNVLITGTGGTPGGANMDVQFNDSGAFGGDAKFLFNKTTGVVTLGDATHAGILNGGNATDGLQLASSAAISPPQVSLKENFFAQDKLSIGPGFDPTDLFVPGGALQFLVSADLNLTPIPAFFGAYTLNSGDAAASSFFGIGGNGTFASPTASANGNNVLNIQGAGFDSTNTLILQPPLAMIIFAVDGDPSPGTVPGQIAFTTTDETGFAATQIWLRRNGFVGIGTELYQSQARLHVRSQDPAALASIVQGAPSQTADLTNWDARIQGSLFHPANPGDSTITLTSSTAFLPAGNISLGTGFNEQVYPYSANNTGTGVLTLVGTITGAGAGGGSTVYQTQVLAKVKATGVVGLAKFDNTGEAGLTPEEGDVMFNTQTKKFRGYDGTAWTDLN